MWFEITGMFWIKIVSSDFYLIITVLHHEIHDGFREREKEREKEREMFDFITRAPLFFKWAYLLWDMWVYFIICSVHISLNDKIFIIKVFKNIYELVLIWLQKKTSQNKSTRNNLVILVTWFTIHNQQTYFVLCDKCVLKTK